MIWTIIEFGAAGLLTLAFIFIAAFMVRGIISAIKGKQILPTEIGQEEGKKLLALEKSAREAVDSDRDANTLLGLSIALHDLDASRERNRLKEIEDGGDENH